MPQGIHGFCSAAAVEGGRLTERAVFRGVGGEGGGGREEWLPFFWCMCTGPGSFEI